MRRTWLAVGATLFTVCGMAGAAQADLLPVGQWDLNEGAGTVVHNDYPLRSGTGTVQGGATWVGGRFQGALAFDGSGDVDVTNTAGLAPANVTLSAWVKSSGSPGDYKHIAVKGGSGCCTGSYALYTGANGGLEFYIGTSPGAYVLSPDAGSGVWNGQWHHVVGTYDGSTVRLYVDGRQVGSGTPDSLPIDYNLPSGSDFVIGNYLWCPGLGFSGDIDEVKVFDRALSPGEIALGDLASAWLPYGAPFDLVL
jgi:hypothetical protein